ncbi:SCP2 sterol-binding domain-containing protein [Shewanella sp. 1_MG-2023]|uniref:ubiquinone biosynthesis accessory factor UbiJ n=1 Tax=unclassified Shewanella TaxID=196818 RepID=UPI0026E421FA|nr:MULTISPECIES: SCP2 sterol-binding domain-containing protein [unclassified Shewanella]MDO6612653.1 SCP2 sterol-binding domain-containing protein [Shewanella sp. 7_MG-2023]MDO6772352.1 SCP2 sterol-binding domain-containing protein [Shewanella sp. 2_MG-2023]MDO6795335.1 SCP2 sterol-binding domain-containing protein [Shewanella sp. 1_MG-2023]
MHPNHFSLLTCAALETAIAQLQAQDQGEYARLKNLHGKVFCIQLSQLEWPLYLVFAKQVQVLSIYDGDIDVSVTADATTLYQISEGESLTELIKQDKLKLDGDVNLLQSFSHYLRHIELDFAEPLSRYIGDAPTHMLVSGAKQLASSAKQVFEKSRSHVGQLTTEEYRLAPHQIEFIHFRDSLEELADSTSALVTRIDKLREKITP